MNKKILIIISMMLLTAGYVNADFYTNENFSIDTVDRSQWVLYNQSGSQGFYWAEDGVYCDPAIGGNYGYLWLNDTEADFRWGNDFTINYEICCPSGKDCDYASRGFTFTKEINTTANVFSSYLNDNRKSQFNAGRNDWAISYENWDGGSFIKSNETAPSGLGTSIPVCGVGNVNVTMTSTSQPDGTFYVTVRNNNNPSNFKTGYTQRVFNETERGYRWLSLNCYTGGGNNHAKLIDNIEITITESGLINPDPVVTILSPANNTITADTLIDVSFTVTDEQDSNMICDLNKDGGFYARNSSVLNNTVTVLSFNASVGDNTFNINCTEDVTNETGSSGNYNLWSDPNDPMINSPSPLPFNTTSFTGYTMNIYGNVTNEELDYILIELDYPNGSLYYQNTTTSFGDPTIFSYNWVFDTTLMPNGDYEMYIYGNDTASNENELYITFAINNCVPDWQCGGYNACNSSDLASCKNATDLNTCGLAYGGDLSEFSDQACNYCTAENTLISQTDCNSVTDTLVAYYSLDNFGACCNVTNIVADCPYGLGNDEGNVTESCSVFDYAEGDLAPSITDTIVKFILSFGAFITVIVLIIGLTWGFKKLK